MSSNHSQHLQHLGCQAHAVRRYRQHDAAPRHQLPNCCTRVCARDLGPCGVCCVTALAPCLLPVPCLVPHPKYCQAMQQQDTWYWHTRLHASTRDSHIRCFCAYAKQPVPQPGWRVPLLIANPELVWKPGHSRQALQPLVRRHTFSQLQEVHAIGQTSW